MARLTAVRETATEAGTPTARRQPKSVISTTPTPDGVSGNADASRGIMVRKTASTTLSWMPKARVRKKIQSVSSVQIAAVRPIMGRISVERGHMPVWKPWMICWTLCGSQRGSALRSRKKVTMIVLATRAMTAPPSRLQTIDPGKRAENTASDARNASSSTIQESIMRRNTMDPRAAERDTPQLIPAKWAP